MAHPKAEPPEPIGIQWRHQFDPPRDEYECQQTDIHNDLPTMTKASFAKDADINVLMKRFGVTDGAIPPAVADPKYYGDFSDVPDFRTALDNIRNAQERFELLPADIRNRFANDPVNLFEFVSNPDNTEESVKLGLLKKRQPPEPPPVTPTQTP